jgi:hypothetical protein
LTPQDKDYLHVPDGGFSWSLSRESLFNFCPRAYFFHYYAALWGIEPFSPKANRKLYILKNIKPVSLWLRGIFNDALRKIFLGTNPRENNEDCFRKAVFQRFLQDKKSIAIEEWRSDPKRPNLFELYYCDLSFETAFELAYNELQYMIDTFCESDIFSELCTLPSLSRIHELCPVSFSIGSLEVWIAPDLIWRHKGKLHFMTFTNSSNPEAMKTLNGALHKIFASGKLNASPDRVKSLIWSFKHGSLDVLNDTDLNISSVIDRVASSSAKLLELVDTSGIVREDMFKKNPENCQYCRFREYCESKN